MHEEKNDDYNSGPHHYRLNALVKFSLISVLSILLLSACNQSEKTEAPASDAELRQKLTGTWRADTRLPDDIHVQSETVVDSNGGYILHLTNTLVDGVRTFKAAGTFQVTDGLLIDTITNDFGGNTRIPWIALEAEIIRVDDHELVLRNSKYDETITYRKDKK